MQPKLRRRRVGRDGRPTKEVKTFTARWSPNLVARLDVDGRTVVLIATHAPAPMDAQTWENRTEHLRELARYVGGLTGPVLVAGDLNITMWSPHFGDLIEQTGLSETRRGYGVQPQCTSANSGSETGQNKVSS